MTEVGVWRRPRDCDTSACPEVYLSPYGGAMVRNTTRKDELVTFDAGDWASFIRAVKNGEYDQ